MSCSTMSFLSQLSYTDNDLTFEFDTQMINQNFGSVVEDEEDVDCEIIFDRVEINIEQQQHDYQQQITLEGQSSSYEADDGYMDYLYNRSLQLATSPECETCEDDSMNFIGRLNQIAATLTDDRAAPSECSTCDYNHVTHNVAEVNSSWNSELNHNRDYYSSPMISRPCWFASPDDILEEDDDLPILTNTYQSELSQYNAHHGHDQISYRGRIYIPMGVERDFLQHQRDQNHRNLMYMQQRQVDISSQDLFSQNSDLSEQNHLQYIQQQIEDDSSQDLFSQNNEENWMDEFIQNRPFHV
uniref:Uncharacterized protein n=2 Tax=Trichogramma kaykai TaxID=54128 RepID=A0ABD2W3I5_9HYME